MARKSSAAQSAGSESAAAKESASVRFYVVREEQSGVVTLVEASTPASALRRVVSPKFSVRVASQSDMLLASNGATVLRAKDDGEGSQA